MHFLFNVSIFFPVMLAFDLNLGFGHELCWRSSKALTI